jgi:hypothetical protein
VGFNTGVLNALRATGLGVLGFLRTEPGGGPLGVLFFGVAMDTSV